MFQVLLLWPDDDPNLGSKRVAKWVKLFTNEAVVIVNVYRCCIKIHFLVHNKPNASSSPRPTG
jgi:hypothetical protein